MIEKIINSFDYIRIKKIINKKELDLEDMRKYYCFKSRIRGRGSHYLKIKGDSKRQHRKYMQFYFSLLSAINPSGKSMGYNT